MPGSPQWDSRADLTARAVRLINDGVVDRGGVPALASRLGYTERHLNRLLTDELGAGPLALARTQRAQTAKTLIAKTGLGLAEIAFASGFGSVRQFNDTFREVYGVRAVDAAARPDAPVDGTISLRLSYRPPLHSAGAVRLSRRAHDPGRRQPTPTGATRRDDAPAARPGAP